MHWRRELGWLSLILFILLAIICCYTGLLLRRCMDSDPRIKTYPDIGELAFGSKGKIGIALLMYIELYLVAIEFLVMEGDNFTKLFPDMDFKFMGLKFGGKQGFVILSSLIIIPTTWLRSLDMLAYVSAGGAISSVIIVASVFWIGTVDGIGFHGRWDFYNLSGLRIAIGLYAFCYGGHPLFPTMYTSMRDRTQFSKDMKSQVTLNLPIGKISSKIAIYTTLINPLAKYALIITPVTEAIEDRIHIHNNRTIILIRTLLVISTVIVALTILLFGYLMALIGSFLSSMV